MRFTVDPWDPEYGTANELDGLEATSAEVVVDVEVAASEWRGLAPTTAAAVDVLFIDGVRRVDARVWLEDPEGDHHAGICATYAAGAVRCDGAARCGPVLVGRGLFTTYGAASRITTAAGLYEPQLAASGTPEGLALALQERMGAAELAVAEECCGPLTALLVVDGPLRGRQHLPRAVGMIKTHHVAYLPTEQHRTVERLQPGERTPLFTLGTSWSRLSWYVRLPGGNEAPWSGVVRCECSPSLPQGEAAALADRVAATLPRFASRQHKDARAPQNLYPIAGIERELRHRLGEPQLVRRALVAAGAWSRGPQRVSPVP